MSVVRWLSHDGGGGDGARDKCILAITLREKNRVMAVSKAFFIVCPG